MQLTHLFLQEVKIKLRKITALLTALLLVLACFGCSSGSDGADKDSTASGNNADSSTKLNFVPGDTISAGFNHTVAVKNDSTVVATGCNDDAQCDVSGWTDIKLP